MSKKLPYFQFEPAKWITGDIQFCSRSAKGLFTDIKAMYWQRDCKLTHEQIVRKFGDDKDLKELITESIIMFDDEDNLIIDFLREQFTDITGDKKQKSTSGSIGNLKRWHKTIFEKYEKGEITLDKALSIAKVSHSDGESIATQSHKIREDKIIQDEIKEYKTKKFTIPSFDVFKDYAIEKKELINIEDLKRKYDIWVELNWHDGNGVQIKNWKTKLLNTLPYLKVDEPKEQMYWVSSRGNPKTKMTKEAMDKYIKSDGSQLMDIKIIKIQS